MRQATGEFVAAATSYISIPMDVPITETCCWECERIKIYYDLELIHYVRTEPITATTKHALRSVARSRGLCGVPDPLSFPKSPTQRASEVLHLADGSSCSTFCLRLR